MDPSNSAIKIENVWKVFGNTSKEALDAIQNRKISKTDALEKYNSVIGVSDVSFEVKQGEIFCVMGLSGSGKSTLVRHINRLLEPTSGKILINGQDVMTLGREDLQELRNKKIGMVFQNFALMPHRSVVDNIAMPLEIRGISKNDRLDAANKILDIVELQGWGNKFAHELSGGMQQRVGLARALAADPEFLLMDEPFSALDPLIRRQLQSEFIKLSKQMKKTTVFITHDLDEAVRVGHRIAIMRDGKVIQIGTPEEIVVNPADEYVADFVKGISRLKVVQAKSIMQSVEAYEKKNGKLWDNPESVRENELLNKGTQDFKYAFSKKKIDANFTFQHFYDISRLVKNRLTSGLGLSYRLYDIESKKLALGLSALREKEIHIEGEYKLQNRLSGNLDFMLKLNKNISISTTNNYQPNIENAGDFRWKTNLDFRIHLSSQFLLSLAATYNYDSVPAENLPESDYQLINSVSYTF